MTCRTFAATLVIFLAGISLGKSREAREPLHFSLIDQLPPEFGTTAFNSIEERRRFPVFGAALQDVVRAGKLPPAELINREVDLRAGITSEKPQPPGTLVIRVFLTQWAQTAIGGATNSETLCRFFVEEVRDGMRVAKLGPFFSRVPSNESLAPLYQQRLATYQAAARVALTDLAAKLPPTAVDGPVSRTSPTRHAAGSDGR